ncbi:sigma-54-dependent Fis family transcriptional regulator [Stutzerimonas azotifigens]|uniref:sigma-54-dependent Fis family transcriptional regulator n=1 Tax=Stutzerimonas azotifigens TaxID=291995 RepID=UPI0003F6F804|nr:sigma-54-dependent Fis family transcriptional regulator [Stutzerimonas azotifigens]
MPEPAKATSHEALVRDSWSRCVDYGLTHGSLPRFDRPGAGELSILLESQQALVGTTQREVLPYYENILANSNCLIMLADSQGRLLQSWGDCRFIAPAQAGGFAPGASWAERGIGTNAIGTVLACGEAVHIQRDEHFLQANRFMAGAASPLYDAERRLIGVLDVSSDSYLPPAHTLGMVRVMSQAVENRLILNLFRDRYFQLAFSTSQDSLDSQWAGLLVFDDGGLVVSANRRADSLLGVSLARASLTALFDLSLAQLLDQPEGRPFILRTAGRLRFHGLITRPRRQPVGKACPASAEALELAALDLGDPRVRKALRQAERMLERDIPILVQGETGVGKEVLVKALHRASPRAAGPLVAVNCAAIPAELVEAELFGYEKGAFTGANPKGSVGLIRKADQGILFLDEVGDMPPGVQARLLRVLQERQVQPLGGGDASPVDIQLISATNRPLREDVEAGRFRRDLYYRIAGLPISLPPLRERQDKAALFQRVLAMHREPHQPERLGDEVLALFERHPWPGNLRQLASVIQVALALAEDGPIRPEHLPDDFFSDLERPVGTAAAGPAPVTDLVRLSGDLQAQLAACSGNLSHLARQLGVSRNTLYKRLREQGLARG